MHFLSCAATTRDAGNVARTMSATLLARNLAAAHGDRTLFTGLDLVVAPGDVMGLVGANGAGKSTLLRLLAELDVPQDGTVRHARRPPRWATCRRNPIAATTRRWRRFSPAAPAWPMPTMSWTPQRRDWRRAAREPMTGTPWLWSAGCRSAAPISTSGPRSRPPTLL